MAKGRRLLNIRSPVTNSLQGSTVKSLLNVRSPIKNSIQDGASPLSEVVEQSTPAKDGNYCLGNTDAEEVADAESTDQNDSSTIKSESQYSLISACGSPPLSDRLREISDTLKFLSTKPVSVCTPQVDASCTRQVSIEITESRTPGVLFCSRLEDGSKFENTGTPLDLSKGRNTGLKKYLVDECLALLNRASKDELKQLKGIGEKRAEYVLKLRESDPEPFKEINSIKDLGLSSKQIKEMMAGTIGDF